MNVKKFMSSWHNKVYPHVVGNILPIVSSKSGRKDAGNIIPDNIIEGRKTIWLNMVSFAWFFIARPNTQEMDKDTIINSASVKK